MLGGVVVWVKCVQLKMGWMHRCYVEVCARLVMSESAKEITKFSHVMYADQITKN